MNSFNITSEITCQYEYSPVYAATTVQFIYNGDPPMSMGFTVWLEDDGSVLWTTESEPGQNQIGQQTGDGDARTVACALDSMLEYMLEVTGTFCGAPWALQADVVAMMEIAGKVIHDKYDERVGQLVDCVLTNGQD